MATAFQRWRALLFLHWEVPLDRLRALVPQPLEIDTFADKAYVGLIPFDIAEMRLGHGLPPVPGATHFLETNLRTYVRYRGRAGLWLFSLDAASSLAALGARVGSGLPYYRARMSWRRDGDSCSYHSERRRPGRPAALDLRYRIGEPCAEAQPGTLEHFLLERYALFVRRPVLGLLEQRVRHRSYPLRAARVEHLDETLVAAAGLGAAGPSTPALFSEGVDVDVLPPKRLH